MVALSFRVADNVFSLCVRAGLEALSCQPALMPNRSTKPDLTIHPRFRVGAVMGCRFFKIMLWAGFVKPTKTKW